MPRPKRARLLIVAVCVVLLQATLSGCSFWGDDDEAEPAPPAASATTTPQTPYNSQFTRDGTYQSHIDVEGLDFVYTLWPTKSTPRTNEWYPRGNKFFSFTFQAYDLDRPLRAPFASKRRVYLGNISVRSKTIRTKGRSESPYRLNADAKKITFDPEPVATDYGMLITSPKGSFELRNQRIRPTALETVGLKLTFRATVWIERSAGSDAYRKTVITETVPIAIFSSKEKTAVARIPINAN
ncbi:hypothetical protein [Nocardioides pacificus]